MKYISIILLLVLSLFAEKIDINFRNLSLNEFIKMIAKITHKNVLLTTNMSGKVDFISVKPLTREELWNVLLNILKSRGYTIVESNGFLQVIPINEAVKLASIQNKNIPQISTEIIALKYVSAADAMSQVKDFLSKYGRIVTLKNKNIIIITDFPENIKKIKLILNKIDKVEKKHIYFVKVNNAKASDVVKKIQNLISSIMPKNKIKLYGDDETDTIEILTSIKDINEIKKLINKFDIKKETIVTKIVNLKNTDAENMSKILTKILKDRFAKNKPSVTVDKENNSIIVVGDKEKVELLDTIIKSLDVPKRQVYVKVRILELSNSKVSNIGQKLGILGGSATNSGLYTLSANLGGPALAFDLSNVGLSMPTIKQGIALGATLDLLETTGAAKKLSEPSILCVNNTPSTLYVGKTVSVITQSTVGASTTDLTKNSYAREDIGLKMTIKPRIDIDNKVSINIKGLIEDILPGSQVGLPITSKREIDTTTIVENGQSIIIGGLIKNNKDITLNKVPFFGDIPILGALFRHKQENNDKSTIAIVLTPYIVNDTSELEKLRNVLIKLNELEHKFVKKLVKKIKEKK
jgi:general secretion pathway protein D